MARDAFARAGERGLLPGALTLVAVASRVLAMALLPTPRGRVADVLDALPAPLFASLAILALVGGDQPATPPVLLAAAAALLGAARQYLAVTLVCGITGFALGRTLLA